MAQDLEQMVLTISADTRQIMRAMKKLEGDTKASTKAIEKQFDNLGKRVNSTFAGLGKGAFAGLAAAFSIREAQRFIDASTRINNALKVAGLSGKELDQVYISLFESAQKNAAPLEALVTLYGRASLVQKELGVSTKDLTSFTDNVALALRVSGRSAQESSGALLQLSQALGSGVVRAQEFNSMLEGALPIVQAAANGIEEAGGSVSKLRSLVNEGKVSSAAFFKGFQAGAEILNRQVAGASYTVAQGFERLQNAAIDAAKRINDASGASKGAISILDTMAAVVRRLADAFEWLAQSRGMKETADRMDGIGAAARNLWNDPSFQNVYELLFDTSGSRAKAAATDAIDARVRGMDELRKAMQSVNAEAQKGSGKPSTRFDDAFSQFAGKKISLKDNPVSVGKDGAKAQRDAFERSLAMTQRQIDMMNVEARTIDMGVVARERARVVVEMETAAREANRRAGKSNIEVTDEQRQKIELLADGYAKARAQLEQLNGPLASFARESRNVGEQLEHLAADSLDRIASDFGDIVAGTKSVEDAFRSMAQSIISELAKIAIKKAVLGPLADLFSGGAGGGPLNLLSFMGKASGGYVSGPGSSTSDSIPARLSNGEFVVNAAATRRHRQLLEAINSGRGMAAGGIVSPPTMPSLAAPRAAGASVMVNVINQASTAQPEVRQQPDGNIEVIVRDMVRGVMADDARTNGPISRSMMARARGFGGR